MTIFGWMLMAGLAALALYLAWRWRWTERERQRLARQVRIAGDETAILRHSHAEQARFLDALRGVRTDGVFLLDEEATVVWMNDAARELCIPDIHLPQPLSQMIQHHETLSLVQDALSDNDPHELQFHSNDSNYLAVARRVPQNPPLIILTVSDVTELLRLGRSRRDFLANVSHDLRTPIAAIQLMVETLRSGAVDDARRQKLLNSIYEQTASLQQLAQEMLDLSMIESGRMPLKLVETPVEALIQPVYQRMSAQAEHAHITLTTHCEPDLRVWADVSHVHRVLQNLMHNAIKFTPAGGDIALRGYAQDDEVTLAVIDSGVGIAPEDVSHVFERFYKADRVRSGGGTGLGLAIARHIVMGHGGRIWVESEPGQGATFFFTLPRV